MTDTRKKSEKETIIEYIKQRMNHLELEYQKALHISHIDEITVKTRIRELGYIMERLKINDPKNLVEYEKRKVRHLKKMKAMILQEKRYM
jgi:hypothetical protein